MQNGQYTLKKMHFYEKSSIFVEILWYFTKMTYSKHELVKLAKFHQISTKNEDFSLIVLFRVWIVRFASVFSMNEMGFIGLIVS